MNQRIDAYLECVIEDRLVVGLRHPVPVLHGLFDIFHCETFHYEKSFLGIVFRWGLHVHFTELVFAL